MLYGFQNGSQKGINSFNTVNRAASGRFFYFVMKTVFTEFNFQHKYNEFSVLVSALSEVIFGLKLHQAKGVVCGDENPRKIFSVDTQVLLEVVVISFDLFTRR